MTPFPGSRFQRQLPRLLLILLVGLFVAWFSYLSILRHQTLRSEGYDLGNVDQMLWNTAHGRPFQFSNWTGKDEYVLGNSRLAMHVEPIYLLIAPLYRLWADVRLLLILQAAVVGLGGVGIWLLARDRLGASRAGSGDLAQPGIPVERVDQPGQAEMPSRLVLEWASLVLAATFLLNPGLQSAILDDFHAVTLTAGLIPFALLFLLRRSYGWFALFALLIAATKEEMPLVVALMGLYILVFQGVRKPQAGASRRPLWAGGLTVVLGVAWSALALLVVIPAFNASSQSPYLARYAHLLPGGELTLAAMPRLVVGVAGTLLSRESLRYLATVLLPTAFLALLDLPLLLIAAPSLAINLLSGFSLQLEGRHYIAPIVPIVVAATAGGIANLARWRGRFQVYPILTHLLLAAVALLFTLVTQYLWGYTPLARDFTWPQVSAHHRLLDRFLAQIPADASVSTQQTLNPHLTHRQQVSIVPFDLSGEYLLLDVVSYPDFNYHDIHTWLVEHVIEPAEFGVVDGADGYLLLRRGAPAGPLPDAFYDFARVEQAAPRFPAQVDFGDALRFLGFDLLPPAATSSGRVAPDSQPRFALTFRPLQPLDRDYFITLYLADDRYQVQGAIDLPQKTLVWYPTSRWQPGETVRVVVDTFTWNTAPLDSYSVALGIVDGGDLWDLNQRLQPVVHSSSQSPRLLNEGTLLHLVRFDNRGRRPRPLPEPRQAEPPAGITASNAQFAGLATLLGYDLHTPKLSPDNELQLDLYWRAQARADRSYTVFVQLLGPDGRVYGQQDNPPGYGTLPTDRWQPGDLIRDQYRFPVASDAPAGAYQIIAGFYDPTNGQRIPVGRSDHVTIEHVTVKD